MGLIHELVIAHIISNNAGMKSELWLVRGESPAGRADLIDSNNNVWEVKHGRSKANVEYTSFITSVATLQARSYVGATVVRNGAVIMDLGPSNAFGGAFRINIDGHTYQVTYETPENGVVLYYVEETDYQESSTYSYFYQKAKNRNYLEASIRMAGPGMVMGVALSFGGGRHFTTICNQFI